MSKVDYRNKVLPFFPPHGIMLKKQTNIAKHCIL